MKILRLKEVIELTGLSKSTIYDYMTTNAFPKHIPLGGRAVGWLESEICGWIKEKISQRDDASICLKGK